MTPSIHQAGGRRDRREFDDPAADEAARWLDREIAKPAPRQRRKDAKLLLAALIRGMDSIERVRAWKGAERRLARERDRTPRSWVMDRLDDREAYLEAAGERPDRLEHGPREPCDCCEPHDEWLEAQRELVAAAKANAGRDAVPAASGDDVVADAFATDGGEPDGE